MVNEEWLTPTTWINSDHPTITAKAIEITKDCNSDIEKATRIFLFVRDDVKFGFDQRFYNVKASEVLQKNIGFCTPKSTLFVALLRASKVPARICFANLSGRVLRGFGVPLNQVDHGYSQVFLNGQWISVDSYTVDRELVNIARKRLVEEGAIDGYGIHSSGTCEWNGVSESFIQKVPDTILQDWGVFKDAHEFYSSEIKHNHKLPCIIPSFVSGFFLNRCNVLIGRFRTKQE